MSKRHNKGKSYKGVGVTTVAKPPCHIGFTQVHENVFVGRASDITDVLDKVDILVPLDNVNGKIWDNGWNGDIYYIPIKDYCVLPKSIEKQKVQYVLDRIAEGKKVAIFCIGGHGRTGYFASLIMGKLGIEDPIKVLREQYCKNAVETNEQVESIAEFIDNYELITLYPCYFGLDDSWLNGYYSAGASSYYGTTVNVSKVVNQTIDISDGWCGQCEYYENKYGAIQWGYCEKCKKTINKYDAPCDDFQLP